VSRRSRLARRAEAHDTGKRPVSASRQLEKYKR
jgi:hypothetical protein